MLQETHFLHTQLHMGTSGTLVDLKSVTKDGSRHHEGGEGRDLLPRAADGIRITSRTPDAVSEAASDELER